ncbi:SusC/RagA family TonB-linked outer membrane protein [Pedobacter africanus]|uniref:TonB-linked outer membrane protein, SusC/RagA family n=1 Tax=Pedobacter africanus TaxID=151894 RepID=A0A1W2CVD6_9SPHI|nr:SusC/RagA family TonB-linked outer membrane protein [Pedobacter africanus]SMC88874.1 TonB-linked outer membrane protein, SusC/RagA family [Pedobacter africanus]
MYKNYTEENSMLLRHASKIWLIMRLTTVILIATFLQVSASGFAQKITLSKSNAPLKTIFKELRNQSGYVFLCTENQLKIAKPVNINVTAEDLEEVLKQVFKNQPLTYNINEKTVTIKEKERSVIDKVIDYFTTIDVSGKIVDENGEPIAGATIKAKGSSITTISDGNGFFSLKNISDDAVLQISYIGYQIKEVKASKDLGSIQMELAIGKLEEVTVNAGYYSVKEKELTGSISRITSKEIENQPVTNVLATMQGRMPGVNIVQNTGMPGSGFEIEIRGQNSLRFNGSIPLYIIDGVPYSAQSIGSNVTSGNMPAENSPLNSINPGDIASIEVLKDADATAIYGSRGANGVVLITTKKGAGGKTAFSTTYSSGIGQVTRFMDVLQTPEYLTVRREAFANDGVTAYPSYAYDINGTWDQNRNTNWQKELIGGTASYNNLQSSLSGGSANTQFLLSGNYSRETTVFPGDFNYLKGGGHLSVNHASDNKRFKASFATGFTAQRNSLPAIDITSVTTTLVPNAPALYDASGKLNWENNTFNNPVAVLENKIKGETYDFIANTLASYDLGYGFTAKGSFGYTNLNQQQFNLVPNTIRNPAFGSGSDRSIVFTNKLNRSSWIIEPQLSWMGNLGDARIDALLGTTFQQQNGDKVVNQAMGFANNSLMANPASATTYRILSSEESLYKYQAVFARVNFNWDGKYLLNLTGRRDGSSRFGPGKKFANFGAIGAGWLFSEERLVKDALSFLSFGKLRASYGISGNDQIGDYQYLDTYGTSGMTYQGLSGLQPSRLFNADFGWETNKKTELALEMGFLKGRISTTFAWFQNRSSNQLVGIPLPRTTGFSSIYANLDAVVQNSGLELSINTVNIKNNRFSWTSSFNLTKSENKLVSFPGLESSTYNNQYVIGQSTNIMKAFHYTGLNPLTGIYQFEDFDGDGAIYYGDDQRIFKNLNPEFYGGLQNQFHYGNLNLDFFLQFVKQENYNVFSGMAGTMTNQPIGVLARWQAPGNLGPYQRYSDSDEDVELASYLFSSSDAAVSDASYIRLKNIALSYQLPKNWTKKFTCRISLQGQNVLTISKYKGIDPEFKNPGYLPPLKVYSSSIQLTF